MRVGSLPSLYAKNHEGTEWSVCKAAAYYSDAVVSEAVRRGPVGGAHSSYPQASTALGRWDEGAQTGSHEGCVVSPCEKGRTCLGNKGRDY